MPASRPIPGYEVPKHRIALSDVLWVLFLVAWTAFGVDRMTQDVAEYRLQQRIFAAQHEPIPPRAGEVPYDATVDQRLIGEAAGCAITLAVVFFGIRRRRQRIIEVRVKWIAAPRERAASAPPVRAAARGGAARGGAPRGAKSGALAADRLSAVVWTDHVARLEKEHA